MGRLDGKVAVITGAASGIGRASARRFASEGALVCVADLADEPGKQVGDEVGGLYVHADVTDAGEVERMYQQAAERFGGIDVLFNNAGISPPDDVSVLDTSLEAWRRVQDVNLTSVFLCCQKGIPYLLRRGGGSVVNTASFVAVMGAATSQISYTASKGGVLALSRELGVEFARQGVRVNALCPGPVNTPLLQELFAKDPERAARRLVHLPMGRFAEAEEIAAAACFLASDDASVLETSVEAWQRVQDVNLKSIFLCCKHGIPHLLENERGGSVINTASFVAVMGAATSQISYTASKGGVLALSRELGVEFARRGVRVNALCPGPVDTPLLRELFAKDPERAARRLVHVPIGRFARAEEIASAALFLASDESSYVTASTFLVDGGLSGAYVTPE